MENEENLDIDPKLKKLYYEKQRLRKEAKEYYQKVLYSPYRDPGREAVFDPALHRYSAMSAYNSDYFKPTIKTFGKFFLYISPIFILTGIIWFSKQREENILRSGLVKYEDRKSKWLF